MRKNYLARFIKSNKNVLFGGVLAALVGVVGTWLLSNPTQSEERDNSSEARVGGYPRNSIAQSGDGVAVVDGKETIIEKNEGTVTVSHYHGMPWEDAQETSIRLRVSEDLVTSFLRKMGKNYVPRDKWGTEFDQFAKKYKEMEAKLAALDDSRLKPEDLKLKRNATSELRQGNLEKAIEISKDIPPPTGVGIEF